MKQFKKIKSNSYAKMMRDYFPASFDNEELNNILDSIVYDDEKTLFAEKLFLENKINEFKNYIYSLVDIEKKEEKSSSRSVKELLEEAGYDFYIISKPEDTEQFRKFYKENELICSFNQPDRKLDHYSIFWIVKKNINEIRRCSAPSRQDDYGTSCCSIKISKSDLYITNRYNHTVNSPDNTFNGNLDNIIMGLTEAFTKEFGFNLNFQNQKSSFELTNFIYKNNKFMYFNYEINNIYYGINKIYKDGVLTIYDSQEFILIDYFLINLKLKKIEIIDLKLKDDFLNFKFDKIIIKDKKFINIDEDIEGALIIYK